MPIKYTIAIKLSLFLYDPDFRSNEKKNWVWSFIWHVHMYFGCQIRISSITTVSFIYYCPWTGSLRHSTVQELMCKNEFLLLLSHEIALKRVCWKIYKEESGQNV